MKPGCYILLLVTLLSSCLPDPGNRSSGASQVRDIDGYLVPSGFQEVLVDSAYSIYLPPAMESSHSLNAEASLQYQDLSRQMYIIIIEESKKELSEALRQRRLYTDSLSIRQNLIKIQVQSLEEKLELFSQSPITHQRLKSVEMETMEVEGMADGVQIYYLLGFAEGKRDLYTLMAWTLLSGKDSYKNEMYHMLRSFRELQGRP